MEKEVGKDKSLDKHFVFVRLLARREDERSKRII